MCARIEVTIIVDKNTWEDFLQVCKKLEILPISAFQTALSNWLYISDPKK